MPYKSQAQRAYLHIHEPALAKKWDKEFPNQGKLPKHVKSKLKEALKIEKKTLKKLK